MTPRVAGFPNVRTIATDGVFVRSVELAHNETTGVVDVEPTFVIGAGLPRPSNGIALVQAVAVAADVRRRSLWRRFLAAIGSVQ